MFDVRRNLELASNDSRTLFIQALRTNPGYTRLICRPDSDPGRRQRFEEFCWRSHCAAFRNELKGAKARRALRYLKSLRTAIGNPSWIPHTIVESLDRLQRDLGTWLQKADEGVLPTWLVVGFGGTCIILCLRAFCGRRSYQSPGKRSTRLWPTFRR